MLHRHRRGFDHASQRFERLCKPILLFAERSDFELAFSRVDYPQNHPAWAGQASSCRCATHEERTRRSLSAHCSGEAFACLLGGTDIASERLPFLRLQSTFTFNKLRNKLWNLFNPKPTPQQTKALNQTSRAS